MTNLDRLVTAMRRWLEDRLPWYDRAREERAMARTERIRRKSIKARTHNEAIIAAVRNTTDALAGKAGE